MAFGSTPKDSGNIPIGCVYVPNNTFVALQGSTNTNSDGSGNLSAPANFNLVQINGIAPSMGGSDNLTAANVPLYSMGVSNGTSVDQLRANMSNISLINVTGATTTQTSTDQKNYNGRGCIIVLNVTNAGTGSITLTIQGKDRVSGAYYTILQGAAVTTNSTTVYRVYPGLTASANATANDLLPRDWNVVVTANNANPITYTVGAIVMV